MTTIVHPHLPSDLLKKAEEESTARELSWLLDSLQETLLSLKSGLEECYALLAPIEPGSTLVMSSPRSECLKGHVTRVGTSIVKGTLNLRLRTHPPFNLALSPTQPLHLSPLSNLRSLLNQALDCVDITRWTGDRHSAPFISSQLHLLQSILVEAISLLGASSKPSSAEGGDDGEREGDVAIREKWNENPPPPFTFSPPLPPTLSLTITPTSSSLLLTIRVLVPVSPPPSSTPSLSSLSTFGTKFAHAIGVQRDPEHDEMDVVFVYGGREVRVKEKVVVESSADPTLLVLGAKLGALERGVEASKGGLEVLMGSGR